MSVHIEQFRIGQFRGICNLAVERLNHINIIAGDNNSGKTSVLEALLLLRDPGSLTNLFRVARMRDSSNFLSGLSLYDSLLHLLPQNAPQSEIALQAICKGEPVEYRLFGRRKKIMIEPEEILASASVRLRGPIPAGSDLLETDAFSGEIVYAIGEQSNRLKVDINAYTRASGREIKDALYLKMVYLSPIAHLQGSVFGRILEDPAYKEICLRILQLFDSEIVDLLLLPGENSDFPGEYIRHKVLGNMPLSTYGDGIKKVLSLANAVAQAAGGVLLIDEIETAIHSKYYDDIFRFIVKACMQFDVQVFITTHNIEAIDALLATQAYEQQSRSDAIRVLTFKKEALENKTYARVLTGRNVYSNREQFGFEVRL